MFSKISVVILLGNALFFAGCSSYRGNAHDLREAWKHADFQHAEAIAKSNEERSRSEDKLLWQLEFATTLRANGKIAESQQVFDAAASSVSYWDSQAETLISKEFSAAVTTPTALPYRGNGVDRIMLQTYRALNFLENSQPEEARPALNAAFNAQSEALAANAKEIEIAQRENAKSNVDLKKLESDKNVSEALENERRGNDEANSVAVFKDYVNPFTTWLHGIYFLRAGTDESDFERAKKSLERVAQMLPENSFVREDLAAFGNVKNAKNEATTYVVFEYGSAPNLGKSDFKILLPLPLGAVPVAISLPRLRGFSREPFPPLKANGVPAQTLCDMRSVVKTAFENSYPQIVNRTVISAFVKAAASATANAATEAYARRSKSAAGTALAIGTLIGTTVFTFATSEADTRIWQTLPERFSLVRLKTPRERAVKISVGWHEIDVVVPEAKTSVIFVKSVSLSQTPIVRTFAF